MGCQGLSTTRPGARSRAEEKTGRFGRDDSSEVGRAVGLGKRSTESKNVESIATIPVRLRSGQALHPARPSGTQKTRCAAGARSRAGKKPAASVEMTVMWWGGR
jgi:hypothetical protein